MPTFDLYSRAGCHLCEILIEELLPLIRGRADLEVRDIDSRPRWREMYDTRIPVLKFGEDVVCEHRLDRAALADILAGLPENSA